MQSVTTDVALLTKAINAAHQGFGLTQPSFVDNGVNGPVWAIINSAKVTVDATLELARYLAAIPGRKNLIWFAGSLPIDFDPGASLSAARVAIYPVDARGLLVLPGFKGDVDSSFDPNIALKMNNTFQQQIIAEHEVMTQIAQQTGGHAYVNINGFKEAVANAVENGFSYYTIGYTPTDDKLDGKFRAIKVHRDDANYELDYRRGFFAGPPAQDSKDSHQGASTAALVAPPPETQILFQARVLPANAAVFDGVKLPNGRAGAMAATLKGPIRRMIVDLTVDAHGLVFELMPDGARQAKVEFVLAADDADGKRVNYIDRSIQFKLKELYEQALVKGLPVRAAFDMPAGQTSLRIVIHDLKQTVPALWKFLWKRRPGNQQESKDGLGCPFKLGELEGEALV